MSTQAEIEKLRLSYSTSGLDLASMPDTPWPLFNTWFKQIIATEIFEPNAMIVATATIDAKPSQRTVLLKDYDENGFTFYTNYESRKGQEMAKNKQVNLIFPWITLHRQVIIQGIVSKVSSENSLGYFHSRPRGSQIGAWASAQSSIIESREQLAAREQEAIKRFEGKEVELPPYWGGYNVDPQSIEFWQGRANRLHDRFNYAKTANGWKLDRLSP